MDMGTKPSWLTEACPPWCSREHREDDHPEDRRHQSTGAIVPTDLASAGIPGRRAKVVELATYLDQPVGQASCWLRLESVDCGVVRLAVAVRSAEELLSVMAEQISRLGDHGQVASVEAAQRRDRARHEGR